MIKSDVLGGPKRSTLEGAIVVRPLTFHTASDGWKAESFFDRLSARKLADFKNSATAYAEAFDPVTKFGNATVQAMLDNPAAAFESLHVWTLAYGMTRYTSHAELTGRLACLTQMRCTHIGLTLATVPLPPSRWRLSVTNCHTFEPGTLRSALTPCLTCALSEPHRRHRDMRHFWRHIPLPRWR